MTPGFDRFAWLFVVVPVLLVVTGVYVVGTALWSIVQARRFLRVAEQVTGTVSGHHYRVQRSSRRDRIVTVPVLRFTTRTGRSVEAEQAVRLCRRVPDRGSEVGVLYDPADPQRAAVVGSTTGVTPESAWTIVFGIVFTAFTSNFLTPWLSWFG
jgi:hypothetical protein